jgi:hypothetical protein
MGCPIAFCGQPIDAANKDEKVSNVTTCQQGERFISLSDIPGVDSIDFNSSGNGKKLHDIKIKFQDDKKFPKECLKMLKATSSKTVFNGGTTENLAEIEIECDEKLITTLPPQAVRQLNDNNTSDNIKSFTTPINQLFIKNNCPLSDRHGVVQVQINVCPNVCIQKIGNKGTITDYFFFNKNKEDFKKILAKCEKQILDYPLDKNFTDEFSIPVKKSFEVNRILKLNKNPRNVDGYQIRNAKCEIIDANKDPLTLKSKCDATFQRIKDISICDGTCMANETNDSYELLNDTLDLGTYGTAVNSGINPNSCDSVLTNKAITSTSDELSSLITFIARRQCNGGMTPNAISLFLKDFFAPKETYSYALLSPVDKLVVTALKDSNGGDLFDFKKFADKLSGNLKLENKNYRLQKTDQNSSICSNELYYRDTVCPNLKAAGVAGLTTYKDQSLACKDKKMEYSKSMSKLEYGALYKKIKDENLDPKDCPKLNKLIANFNTATEFCDAADDQSEDKKFTEAIEKEEEEEEAETKVTSTGNDLQDPSRATLATPAAIGSIDTASIIQNLIDKLEQSHKEAMANLTQHYNTTTNEFSEFGKYAINMMGNVSNSANIMMGQVSQSAINAQYNKGFSTGNLIEPKPLGSQPYLGSGSSNILNYFPST